MFGLSGKVLEWFSQCIPILLGSLCSDMGLNITCMLMTHSCIYHWILKMSFDRAFRTHFDRASTLRSATARAINVFFLLMLDFFLII